METPWGHSQPSLYYCGRKTLSPSPGHLVICLGSNIQGGNPKGQRVPLDIQKAMTAQAFSQGCAIGEFEDTGG
jgi:hypothetical protein